MNKRIFLIHRAPLVSELSEDFGIIPIDQKTLDMWNSAMKIYIPVDVRRRLMSSPDYSCIQTALALFPNIHIINSDNLKNFDCSVVDHKKLYEMSKIEFENIIKFTSSDMGYQAQNFIHECYLASADVIIAISHKWFIKYLYHYMTGNRDISPFETIKDESFKLSGLDMLEINMEDRTVVPHWFLPK